jgi:hypothetical protein
MNYSVALHNGTWHFAIAILLAIAGTWATIRVYASTKVKIVVFLVALAVTTALSVPMIFWGRSDGPCGTVWGLPLTIERLQTACGDVFHSTGLSWPHVVMNLVTAFGLAHGLVLGTSRAWKARAPHA